MDPVTGGTLITGLRAIRDILKDSKDARGMDKFLEIQVQISELLDENQALKAENAGLKERLAQKEAVELRADGAVWRKGETGTRGFGGFCPNCYGTGGKLLILLIFEDEDTGVLSRSCSVCKMSLDRAWQT